MLFGSPESKDFLLSRQKWPTIAGSRGGKNEIFVMLECTLHVFSNCKPAGAFGNIAGTSHSRLPMLQACFGM